MMTKGPELQECKVWVTLPAKEPRLAKVLAGDGENIE